MSQSELTTCGIKLPDKNVSVWIPSDDVTGEAECETRDVLGLVSLIEQTGFAGQGQTEKKVTNHILYKK